MIDIQGLTKKYGDFTALDQLTLHIEQGTVFGFVGSNGAGKSTTFSILATLLAPTSGTAYINGANIIEQPNDVRRQLGYMPDFFGVYDQLKTDEYLDFYGASYGLSSQQRAELIPTLLELVKLTDKRYEYVDLLSRGMKQRLCLARALIHDPAVLILDEPASGLDPRSRSEMRDIVKALKMQGKTILISSHILPELAEMCDEIGVLEKGRLIARGSVDSIQGHMQGDRQLTVKVLNSSQQAASHFRNDPLVSNVQIVDDNTVICFYRGSKEQQVNLLKQALQHDILIYQLQEERQDLEDIFLTITKGAEK